MINHKIVIGDEVFIGGISGRGGHGAYIMITKLNKKSIVGIEREGSYKPGIQWRLSNGIEIALVGKDADNRMIKRWGTLNDGIIN